MTRTLPLLAMVAAAALAGCDRPAHIPNASEQAAAEEAAAANAAANVVLPPSIVASKIYRCKDNSVVYIDWLSDNKTANIKSEQGGAATALTAATEGGSRWSPRAIR